MVKVKLIKTTDKYSEMFLNKIFEAFEIDYASGEKQYVLNTGGCILWADAENCEVVETESCEVGEEESFSNKTEQLQAQLDCTNENYSKLNEKYMITQAALNEACKFIEEYVPGVYLTLEELIHKPLMDLFLIKAESLVKRG